MSTPVEQIKDRLDVVDVIGSYIKLTKAGKNYKSRCPFHNEKTPSFSVSQERQSFYCFGCQASGDIFSFVEKFEGLEFGGALKLLADRAGVKLTKVNEYKAENESKLFLIMEEACLHFESNLKSENKALDYLKNRGVNQDSIDLWRIGFAKDEWRDLHDALLKKGFALKDLLSAGVIKENNGKYYDTFRGRITFPIFDQTGRVIAFSGRILEAKEGTPKYLNSPETELFKKSEVLYGLHFAKPAMRKLDYAVLVEGQLDIVLSHQAGVRNTVASSGTALTLLHLNRIGKVTKRVILAYDSDEAGIKAGKRAAELAISLDIDVKVANLPEGEDPASVINKNPEDWKDVLKSAVSIVEFALLKAVKKAKAGIPLVKEVNKEVLPFIALMQNELIKSEYISLVSRRINLPEKAIEAEVSKLAKSKEVNRKILGEETIGEIIRDFLSPEEIFAGLILWQETLKDPAFDIEKTRQRFYDAVGPERGKEILESDSLRRENLIFEMEEKFHNFDLGKVAEEMIQRIELKVLQNQISDLSRQVDLEEDPAKREKLLMNIKTISNKLSVSN